MTRAPLWSLESRRWLDLTNISISYGDVITR
jgi:hypothetical protein